MRENGNVINVSSRAGRLSSLSPELRIKFLDPNLSIEGLNELVEKFVKDVASNTWKEQGWPKTTYGVSKVALTVLTKILARDEKRIVSIVSMCPGYVNTDMSSHKGTKTPDEGASTAIWLSFLPYEKKNQGKFFAEEKEVDIENV